MTHSQLIFEPYSLTTDEPFGTAHGQRSHTDIVLLRLEYDGVIGLGEASMPPYYDESQSDMKWFLSHVDVDELLSYQSIDEAMRYLYSIADGYTASKAALDMALHDLRAKQSGQSVMKYLGLPDPTPVASSITISLSDMDRMLREVEEYRDYPILKIKLGKGLSDIDIIKSIRKYSDQKIWIDANQGWGNIEEAIQISQALESMGVELIEQPFKIGSYDMVKSLTESVNIPIVADEDCQRLSDIDQLIACYDAINIKLMKCTGLNEALKMITKARNNKLKVMLGCMTESSIGISAAAQIAHLVDWADVDGNMLINNDPAKGASLINGILQVPAAHGMGCNRV